MCSDLYPQNIEISGIVVDKDSGEVLEDVEVFIDNSSINTITDSEGRFTIMMNSNSKQSLIFSRFGYAFHTLPVKDLKNNLRIEMELEAEMMKELIIDKSAFSRKELMIAFKYFFLGNTKNAKKAKIENEDDIQLYFDTTTNTLIASADWPVRIQNKNLGYELSFYMETFAVQYNSKKLDPKKYSSTVFLGYTSYTKVKENKSIYNERMKIYENNAAAFFRHLVSNELSVDSFLLAVGGMTVNPDEYFTIESNENGAILFLKQKPTKKKPVISDDAFSKGIFNPNAIKEYTTEEIPFGIINMKTEEQSIIVFRKRYVRLDAQGNLEEPDAIYFGGYFGDLKMADMLPVDFIIEEKKERRKYNEEDLINDKMFQALVDRSHQFYTSEPYVRYSKLKNDFHKQTGQKSEDFHSEKNLTEWMKNKEEWNNENAVSELILLYKDVKQLENELSTEKNEIENAEAKFKEKYGETLFDTKYKELVIKKTLQSKMK